MRISVDVDGVLANVIPMWLEVYNTKYNANISPEQISSWDFYNAIGITREVFFKVFSEAWSRWREIKETEEDLDRKLALFRNLGQVDIVTGRSKDTLNSVKSWLKLKGIPYDRFVAVSARSSKAALRYDLYIDDAPKVAVDSAARRRYVLLYDQPWNREVQESEYITRIRNLSDAYQKAKILKQKLGESCAEDWG